MATLEEIDYFDLLSNEVVANIVGFLDLLSLYRFASSSKRLYDFKQISNDQWRRYYAQKWLLDDRELAIYKNDDWQKLYFARLKSENDYLLRIQLAKDTPPKESDARYWRQPREATIDQEDIYHAPSMDPWARILLDNDAKNSFHLIEEFFTNEPFTDEDTKREILSGRFEILVTALSRFAAEDTETLTWLGILRKFYTDSKDYKEQRKRPFGLLGLLAKYLDITLPVHLLHSVTTALWEAVTSGEVTEDLFVGLDIVPKLITIIMKTTDVNTKNAALGALTWFKPSNPDNTKLLVNPAFMRILADMLFGENLTHNLEHFTNNFEAITPLSVIFGQFNMPVVEEVRLATRLIELLRRYSNEPKKMKNLSSILHAFCVYSKDCCFELTQHETALEFLMNLITSSKDESNSFVAENALSILVGVSRDDMGADRLLELNAVDRLLPFMEDPTNTHLFSHIYFTLHNLSIFARENGFGDEINARLLQYKDVLVERGGDLAMEEVQEACSGFWTNFSCCTY